MKYFWYGPLAQLVEQLTLNQRVAGSSPSRPIGCQTHGTGKCWCESKRDVAVLATNDLLCFDHVGHQLFQDLRFGPSHDCRRTRSSHQCLGVSNLQRSVCEI